MIIIITYRGEQDIDSLRTCDSSLHAGPFIKPPLHVKAMLSHFGIVQHHGITQHGTVTLKRACF
jgi:hypothetical protein